MVGRLPPLPRTSSPPLPLRRSSPLSASSAWNGSATSSSCLVVTSALVLLANNLWPHARSVVQTYFREFGYKYPENSNRRSKTTETPAVTYLKKVLQKIGTHTQHVLPSPKWNRYHPNWKGCYEHRSSTQSEPRQVLRLTQKASGSGKLTNLNPLGAHPKRKTGLNSWTLTILSLIIIAYHWLSLIASASKKSPSVPCISALKLRPCHVNINIIGQIYNFWNLALINCQKLFAADSLFLFGSFLLCVLIWWSQFLITFCDFNAL